MQNTTQAWKEIVATDGHYYETRVTIEGNVINEADIRSITRTRPGMPGQNPTIGGALAAEQTSTIHEPAFALPKQAQIVVETRARVNNRTSGWIPQGTYYVDTRSTDEGDISLLTLTAYDAMAKADADYPDTAHEWPYASKSVVAEIAAAIGVTVDSRTNDYLSANYKIDLPASYTMRETLGYIAAMYCGNFVITDGNKLRFIPLYNTGDFDFTYIADESGNALVFGNEGWCILV